MWRARDADETPWPVLTDVMISILLLVVLLFAYQYLRDLQVRQAAARAAAYQAAVRRDVRARIPDTTALRIDSLRPDQQRMRFDANLLFATCSAKLRPDGEALMRMLGEELRQHASKFARVDIEGHADRRPVGRGCAFASNWELSSARATSVVVLLASDSLVAPRCLAATGRAEFVPFHPDSLELNRRIEVRISYRTDEVDNFSDSEDDVYCR